MNPPQLFAIVLLILSLATGMSVAIGHGASLQMGLLFGVSGYIVVGFAMAWGEWIATRDIKSIRRAFNMEDDPDA